MDANNDYFKTYMYPSGVLRIKVEKAWGFAEEAKGTTKKLLSKITRSHPDCYAKVELGRSSRIYSNHCRGVSDLFLQVLSGRSGPPRSTTR